MRKKIVAATIVAFALIATVGVSAPAAQSSAATAAAPAAKATGPAAVKIESFNQYGDGLQFSWTPVKEPNRSVYSLKLSVDGSAYKKVDGWGGYSYAIFDMHFVTTYFPKAKAGFKGSAVLSYRIDGKSSADSIPLNFIGNPRDINSLRWTTN